MKNRETIVVFGIDMETDVGSYTPFYEGVKKGTPILLDLFAKKKVEASFFFTGDCAKKHPEAVKLVQNSGNEVGCHSMCHETVGDVLYEIPNELALLPEEVPLRLKIGNDIVADILGEQPKSFRSPRLWGSTAVVNALEDMGYIADASYPMFYYKDRLVPYHPSKEDWTEQGDMNIIEIPNFADMAMESTHPLEMDRDQWPIFRTKGAGALMEHVNNFDSFVKEKELPTVLCFYMHPWEFVPMKKEYYFGMATVIPDTFLIDGCGERGVNGLSEIIDILAERGAAFMSAKSLAQYWKKEHLNED